MKRLTKFFSTFTVRPDYLVLPNWDCICRHDAPMLNDKYFPKDGGLLGSHVPEVEGYKYPHLQLRNISYSRGGRRLLDSVSLEARGGELVAILATNSKYIPFE
jgi:hypothetical protein